MSHADLPYFLVFARVKGIGSARTRLLQQRFGSLAHAWQAKPSEFQQAGLDAKSIASLLSARTNLSPLAELDGLHKAGIQAICWDDEQYPPSLRNLSDAPPVLYVKGQITQSDMVAIGIVGTRNATVYGREVAEMLATELARNGVTVVSGLARGIDGVAHNAAIDAGGRTLAVMGSGVDVIYPPEHRKLAQQISEHGALISDYPPGTQPEATNFPPRNRIISGLSLGVVVVEADEKSGALITTQFAADHGREVFAVPGNIFSKTSRGTNKLIQNGAKAVTSVNDILEELNLGMVTSQLALQMSMPIDATDLEAALLAKLSHEPISADELIRQLDHATGEVTTALMMLELKGIIRGAGNNQYVLSRKK
ncbi:MAG: DNA-processing protein DprA [Anaerolineae bacterium]|nr:DNA-processing protein DprA [Anaerolineae bacterium]